MLQTERGTSYPLGASLCAQGINFAVFSPQAREVSLLIYYNEDDSEPAKTLVFDPKQNRTGHIWHICVLGLTCPVYYHYCCDAGTDENPCEQARLLDPYALAVSYCGVWGAKPCQTPKAIFNPLPFDWQNDIAPQYHIKDTIIYETHVKGLSWLAAVQHPGTYTSVVEMIPYLKSLGITAIELLPVFEFNTNENPFTDPTTGEKLTNYWGYSTIAFFAPKASYATQPKAGSQVNEFKTMVRALHKAGLEVFLDVVFNHTAEGNEQGPTFNFKGFANDVYYMLCEDARYYKNYSGCGNSMNVNHPVVKQFVLDCLRYWVDEMHVDGFRFDLAAAMCRDNRGGLWQEPPPVLRYCGGSYFGKNEAFCRALGCNGGVFSGKFSLPGI